MTRRRGAPARAARTISVVATLVAAALLASGSPAVAADEDPTTTSSAVDGLEATDPLPPATPGPPLPEEEAPPPPPDAVPPTPPPGADEAGRVQAAAALKATQTALRKAQAAERKVAQRLLPLGARKSTADASLAAVADEDEAMAAELSSARLKVKRMAVAGYVRGGDTQPMDYLLRSRDPVDLERRRSVIASATDARNAAVRGFTQARHASSARLRAALDAAESATNAFHEVEVELDAARAVTALLTVDVAAKRQLLDHATAAAVVEGTDIPRLLLDAYRRAAATLARRAPACRVGWTAIAAIGRIESNHGRYRGAQFALNGDVYPRIVGIPLDGTRSALIRDTDLGLLDGDVEFDRAVGPMQFIPSTWSHIAEDGNGDGVRDPNNVYDATLGTAAYLCRAVAAGGLDTDDGLRPAFFSYNHSADYVDLVLATAHQYAEVAAS